MNLKRLVSLTLYHTSWLYRPSSSLNMNATNHSKLRSFFASTRKAFRRVHRNETTLPAVRTLTSLESFQQQPEVPSHPSFSTPALEGPVSSKSKAVSDSTDPDNDEAQGDLTPWPVSDLNCCAFDLAVNNILSISNSRHFLFQSNCLITILS